MHHTKVFIAVYNTAVNKGKKKEFAIKSGNNE
jgi:hypothetical protein